MNASSEFEYICFFSSAVEEEDSEWDWLLLDSEEVDLRRKSPVFSLWKSFKESAAEFAYTLYEVVFAGYEGWFSNLLSLKEIV